MLFGIESRGHSGYASEGNDIVCAVVSTVMTVTESYLTDICGYDTEVQVGDEPWVSVKLKTGTEEEKKNCHKMLRAALATLEEAQGEYPRWLRVTLKKDGSR